MRGYPKYEYENLVLFIVPVLKRKLFKFKFEIGTIYIIDKFGVFEDSSDVYYDILVERKNMMYKHIKETKILLKLWKKRKLK